MQYIACSTKKEIHEIHKGKCEETKTGTKDKPEDNSDENDTCKKCSGDFVDPVCGTDNK